MLTLQTRGAGEFQVALTAYVTGEKTPVYHVITENWSKQNSDWQSCRLPFSLPPKTRQISLIIRQSNGKGDFADENHAGFHGCRKSGSPSGCNGSEKQPHEY